MPPPNSQPQTDPNDAAANLALATHISTQAMAQQMPQPIEPGAGDPNAQTTKTDANIQQIEQTITQGMDSLKKEIKGQDLRSKIDEIESELQDILGDDTNDGQTATS